MLEFENMRKAANPIICAVDATDIARAQEITGALAGTAGAIKLGLEFFTANGAAGVQQVVDKRLPVFLDLKFHDIPNTVSKAIQATAGIDTFMMTVHTAGGRAMLQAAIDASNEVAAITGQERPLIIGVTVLTSMDQDDLHIIGVDNRLNDQVLRLADLAQSSGLDGVVCSPHEIALLRKHFGDDFVLVVPGIRPEGSSTGDQKRIMTPRDAIEKGADYLVIGRPITEAPDMRKATQDILTSINKKSAA